MQIRPLEKQDLPAAAAIRVQPEVGQWLGLNRMARVSESIADLEGALGLGAFDGQSLRACVFLRERSRPRNRHSGSLEVFCLPDAFPEAEALLRHTVDAASRWRQLAALDINLDADSPWRPLVEACGFERYATLQSRRWRAGARRDALLMGWTRDGLPKATDATEPILPAPGPKLPVRIRPSTPADAAHFAVLHREESVLRGTLQTPFRTADTWAGMLGSRFTAADVVAEGPDGQIFGAACTIRCPAPAHATYSLGIAVAREVQGRGVGRKLFSEMVQISRDDLGAARIELEVVTDNPAARALYESLGFQAEGVWRASGWRGDGFTDSVYMALTYP